MNLTVIYIVLVALIAINIIWAMKGYKLKKRCTMPILARCKNVEWKVSTGRGARWISVTWEYEYEGKNIVASNGMTAPVFVKDTPKEGTEIFISVDTADIEDGVYDVIAKSAWHRGIITAAILLYLLVLIALVSGIA